MDLTITLESACDLNKELADKYNLKIVDMNYMIGDDEYSTATHDIFSSNIYGRMRKGDRVFTSQINEAEYESFFEKNIENEKPILHIGFSSGLSGTIENARMAADKINKKRNKQVVYVVDTLCGSCGQGMLAMFAREFSQNADTLEDVLTFIEDVKLRINHCYTLDTLKHQVAGGRVKSAVALIGKILNIKPVMRLDETGKLALVSKVFSRKKSICALADRCIKCFDPDFKMILIAHADCEQDARYAADLIKKGTNFQPIIVNLGPIIGGHSGPGTLSVYYVGEKR